jgi:hypothetical protein
MSKTRKRRHTYGFSRRQWIEDKAECLKYTKAVQIITAEIREEAERIYMEYNEEHDKRMFELRKRKLGY